MFGFKGLLLYVLIGIMLVVVFSVKGTHPQVQAPKHILNINELMTDVQQAKIGSINISDGMVYGRLKNNESFMSQVRMKQEEYKNLLVALSNQSMTEIKIPGYVPSSAPEKSQYNWLPWAILFFVWLLIVGQMRRRKL